MPALPLSHLLKSLSWSFRRSARKASRHREQFRPRLEALEERSVPAVFPVTTLADSGPGSLRQAILDANASPGPDEIEFAQAVRGTITLTSGQLVVTGDLTVKGPGAGGLTVSGNNVSRVFSIGGGPVLLAGLTIARGYSDFLGGGGIYNGGNLTLRNCSIVLNTSLGTGGGIFSFGSGSLTVNGCTIEGNVAVGDGGGIDIALGRLVLSGSTVEGNVSQFGGAAASRRATTQLPPS